MPAGEIGFYRTTNSAIGVEGLKLAGALTVQANAQGLYVADGIQQDLWGTTWSNSLSFSDFETAYEYRSTTNIESSPIGLTSTVLIVTRAGTDTPDIMITSSPPLLYYSVTNIVLGGTNNPHVVGTMWITNIATGESRSFPAPVYPDRAWLTPACALIPGTNMLMVHGSNIWGTVSDRTLSVVRGGLSLPALAISSAPPANVGFAITNCTLIGTNNEHVAEVWVSNALNGAITFCGTSTGSTWASPPIPLEVGTNRLNALGYNVLGQVATSTVTVVRYPARTFYVDAASTNPAAPYQSWNTAARLIPAVLSLALDADTILVGPGTYTNSLTISNQIHLVSSSGPRSTIIQANGGRCITITHSNAVMSGFTITGGRDEIGAGVYMSQTNARIENCIITNNSINSSQPGSARADGGGIWGGQARNCLITSNSLHVSAGGKGDAVAFGAGAACSILENCTVVGNLASASGYHSWAHGAGYICTFVNSIVWNNPREDGGSSSFDQCYTSDPGFADGEYHLASWSPCINAGSNQDWMVGATDLDGAPRVMGGTVDIGCYETSRSASLAPPALDAPIAIPSGASGLLRSTNDLIWVQGTKPGDCLVVLSVAPSNWYSTNGMFQTPGGTTWSNLVPRTWTSPTEIKTWLFRCASTNGATLGTQDTILQGTAAGYGAPEIRIGSTVSTVNCTYSGYVLSGDRNIHTLEHMWASNLANGAVAFFDAPIYPATNWVAPALPLAVGTNMYYVFGTNMLGSLAVAQYEVYMGLLGTAGAGTSGCVRIEWIVSTSLPCQYQWQRSIDLPSGVWSNFGNAFVATQNVQTLTETNANDVPAFYRMMQINE